MLRRKIIDDKIHDEIAQIDCNSTTSSSLVTDFSSSDFKCICFQLPKAVESQCVVTLESGIGSSICSFDTHPNGVIPACVSNESDNINNLYTNLGNLCIKYECHDLPPVTEEEDFDGLISILNSQKENDHLDIFPWRDETLACNLCTGQGKVNIEIKEEIPKCDGMQLCQKWCCYPKPIDDDLYAFISKDNGNLTHLPNPWNIDKTSSVIPILSPMCHEKDDMIIRSEICRSHNNQSFLSDNECCVRRASVFSNCRPHICWERRASIFEEDSDECKIISTAAERVLEWLNDNNNSDCHQSEIEFAQDNNTIKIEPRTFNWKIFSTNDSDI